MYTSYSGEFTVNDFPSEHVLATQKYLMIESRSGQRIVCDNSRGDVCIARRDFDRRDCHLEEFEVGRGNLSETIIAVPPGNDGRIYFGYCL